MDNLIKLFNCEIMDKVYECNLTCPNCEYYQEEYNSLEDVVKKITALEKSNRNWRRKCQRLRKELKEVKKNGIS